MRDKRHYCILALVGDLAILGRLVGGGMALARDGGPPPGEKWA